VKPSASGRDPYRLACPSAASAKVDGFHRNEWTDWPECATPSPARASVDYGHPSLASWARSSLEISGAPPVEINSLTTFLAPSHS
jgi:hypothetical protein